MIEIEIEIESSLESLPVPERTQRYQELKLEIGRRKPWRGQVTMVQLVAVLIRISVVTIGHLTCLDD